MGRVTLLKEEEVLASWCNKTVFFFYGDHGGTVNLYKTDGAVVEIASSVLLILFFLVFF